MKINSDASALKSRADINKAAARCNIEEWILDEIKLEPGMSVLDPGCGMGKQLFNYAKKVSGSGLLMGFDLSSDPCLQQMGNVVV